jgi:hypothetical protein
MSPAKKKSARKKKAPPPPPKEFFEVAAPRVLTAMSSLCASMGGSYAFVVEGEGGGAWTLDFTDASVREGSDGADLTVTLPIEDFPVLATAKGELRKLVADGTAACEGEKDRLENLSMVVAFLQRK